jgi:hypothetical protein
MRGALQMSTWWNSLAVVAICVACMPVGVRAQTDTPPVVADTQAARHVGRTVTVQGRVANVKVSRHRATTFLNFGRPYPDHSFSAWIPDSLADRFGDVESLAGKLLRVTGTVWMQDGKWPAMTLVRGDDLLVLAAP